MWPVWLCGAKHGKPCGCWGCEFYGPHNISQMNMLSGWSFARLCGYVQKLVPLSSGAFAPRQRFIGRGAMHVFITLGIAGPRARDALALRQAVASDRPHARNRATGSHFP